MAEWCWCGWPLGEYWGSAAPANHSSLMRSAAFSAIMMMAAMGLPDTTTGMTEASTTRRPATPRTLPGEQQALGGKGEEGEAAGQVKKREVKKKRLYIE